MNALDFLPLEKAVAADTVNDLATVLGVSRRHVMHWRSVGVTEDEARDLAAKAELDVGDVWPQLAGVAVPKTSPAPRQRQWEVFSRSMRAATDKPMLTVRANGNLGITAGGYRMLGEPAAVLLLYAREERLLGVRAAGEDHRADALPVRKSGGAWIVTMRRMIAYYDIPVDGSRRYLAQLTDDGILYVDLNAPGEPVVRGSRTRTAR